MATNHVISGGAVFLMLLVGLELTREDFRWRSRFPGAVLASTVSQLTLLPLAAAAVIVVFRPETPAAAGLILVAASPGGFLSNTLSVVARANTALSVTLSAISGLLAIVTMPALAALGLRVLLVDDAALRLPVLPVIGELIVLMFIPISLGMFLRWRRPELYRRLKPAIPGVSAAVILGVLGLVIFAQRHLVLAAFAEITGMALAFTAVAMAAGYAVGAAIGVDVRDRFTLVIEHGSRNLALVAIVAAGILERSDILVFAAAFFVVAAALTFPASVAFRLFSGQGGGAS